MGKHGGAMSGAMIVQSAALMRRALYGSVNAGKLGVAALQGTAGWGASQEGVKQGFRTISTDALKQSDRFEPRHNSPSMDERDSMAKACGFPSMDALIDATVPDSIRLAKPMTFKEKYNAGIGENEFIAMFKEMAEQNVVNKNFIGMGYYGTILPPVIQRNLLENPGWYTQYTPYQAEISQGRLESLLNYQTVITDLTGMEISNASLLDEATAAAEAMTLCSAVAGGKKPKFLVDSRCHPQTIAVCESRASGLGLEVVVTDFESFASHYGAKNVCGVLVQYPNTDGSVIDYASTAAAAKAAGVMVVAATDLLALTKLTPPGEWGADICVGSAQRFGVPMGYGGPHAGFFSCAEKHKRLMPGRIIGVSIDAEGNPALRMAMQTREQHIRRDKATSNICTAQALLANIAGMYAVYHGPEGLKTISTRVNGFANILAAGADKLGFATPTHPFFDTVALGCPGGADKVMAVAEEHGCNFRKIDNNVISISFDETTTMEDLDLVFDVLSNSVSGSAAGFTTAEIVPSVSGGVPAKFERSTPFMTQSVFSSYHTEHEMLRYLKRLENRDLSLCHSMIPLGSCTMKLNATSQMIPVTWPELANIHPYAPLKQTQGYQEMFEDLAEMLCTVTGFDSMSLQPNSGASGEYAGLMAIRQYHLSRGDKQRNVCIIPTSAHGTNPASAIMAGMKIVTTGVDKDGFVSIEEVRAAAEKHKDNLAAFMITYPSTHGLYEDGIDELCEIIHTNGGQVYMDGANMNAQVGLTSPGLIGADVCHLNLHKTFCIPHGGGGPGMGPIGVKKHLAPFLPNHPSMKEGAVAVGGDTPFGVVAAAPYGSALILPISFAYIALMGSEGLTNASKRAILNANYMSKRLADYYPVLFSGKNDTCAHEFILDMRPIKDATGIEVADIAKRLMDYGFHSPTMSWPVAGTLMIEPTESESKAELDRFCDAMLQIRSEIQDVLDVKISADDSPLRHAPHTAEVVAGEWDRPYPRSLGPFPAEWTRAHKFWPQTSRIDDVYGDRNLVASRAAVDVAVAQTASG